MAHILADRVMETASTTGTGAFALGGAYTGYRTFAAVMSVSDTCRYCIAAIDVNGNDSGDWETGLGTYSALNTLTRTTVEASSNAGAAVAFAAGNKRVMLGASAAFLNTRVRPISFFFTGSPPTASEVLALYPAIEALTIAANFSGSKACVLVNPTASLALDVTRQVNGSGAFSTIGTITIGTGGAVTWATAGGAVISVAAGDVIKVTGDSDGDTTAQGAINIKGLLA